MHLARAAAARTFWTAGTSKPIRIAMMAMTTSSSMRVKARRRLRCKHEGVRMTDAPVTGEGLVGSPRVATRGLGHDSRGQLEVVAAGAGVGDDLDGQRRGGLGLVTCVHHPAIVLVGIRPRLGGDEDD